MTPWPAFDSHQAVDLELLGALSPLEVLYEFDGPCIFVSETPAGTLVLAYLSEDLEDECLLRYVLATTSSRTIDELKHGVISVREAMDRGSLWLVDMDYRYQPRSAFSVRSSELPEDALPSKHVMLWSSLEPVLTLRLEGTEIVEGRIPAAAFYQAADVASKAFKPIFEWAARARRNDTSGRPPEWLRHLYSMPAQRVAYGSLEISFKRTALEADSQAMLQFPAEDLLSLQEIQQTAWTALQEGLAWATSKGDAPNLDDDESKSMAMLETMKRLAPTSDGPVTAVHLWGPMVGETNRVISLDKRSSKRIRHALTGLKKRHEVQLRVLTGRIRELDLDKLTLILRSSEDTVADVSLVLEDERLLEVAREAHYQESEVNVAARSEDKKSWTATEIEFAGTGEPGQGDHADDPEV